MEGDLLLTVYQEVTHTDTTSEYKAVGYSLSYTENETTKNLQFTDTDRDREELSRILSEKGKSRRCEVKVVLRRKQ